MIPERFRKGEIVGARRLNGLREFLISLAIDVEWPLIWKAGTANARLAIDLEDEFWVRITGNLGGGSYSWIEIVRTPAGWVDSGRNWQGIDPASEANNVSTLSAGTRVFLRRQRIGNILVFQEDTCA